MERTNTKVGGREWCEVARISARGMPRLACLRLVTIATSSGGSHHTLLAPLFHTYGSEHFSLTGSSVRLVGRRLDLIF